MQLSTHPAYRYSTTLTMLLPGLAWVAYAWLSSPLMLPGLDIWIHLASIEFEGRRQDAWHIVWGAVFRGLGLEDPFAQAKLVHSTQLMLLGGLVFAAARWIMKLVAVGAAATPALLNVWAWLAVLVWVLMHGTVSSPINSGTRIWFAWAQWYSVNYQIALPLYVFGVSAFLYALFARSTPQERPKPSWRYWLAAFLSTVGVATLHAAELPYVMWVVLMVGVIWFKWSRRWHYLSGMLAILFIMVLGLELSHRAPTGFGVLMKGGPEALFATIEVNGQHIANGLNRGNASWNYWYWASLALSCTALVLIWRWPSSQSRSTSFKVVALIACSAIPAAMLHFQWTSGILAMITYPNLAWRFTFSSLLFVGPSMALMVAAMVWPKLARWWVQMLLGAVLVLGVLLASRQTETNLVSYQYARGFALSLSPEHMRFGLQPQQSEWLDKVHQQLKANPPKDLVCTDMYTAYYLFFVKDYDQVVLPRRISRFIDKKRREGDCRFPRDGGDVVKGLGLGPVPWKF
jgi:hypothetical protein